MRKTSRLVWQCLSDGFLITTTKALLEFRQTVHLCHCHPAKVHTRMPFLAEEGRTASLTSIVGSWFSARGLLPPASTRHWAWLAIPKSLDGVFIATKIIFLQVSQANEWRSFQYSMRNLMVAIPGGDCVDLDSTIKKKCLVALCRALLHPEKFWGENFFEHSGYESCLKLPELPRNHISGGGGVLPRTNRPLDNWTDDNA